MENKETLLPNPTILTDSSIDAHIQAAMQATLLSEAEKERIFDREFVPQMSALYNFAYYLCRDETQAEKLNQAPK
jgi:hypothetical protein